MKDYARMQQQIVEKEYLHLVAENITQEAFILGGKQRKWPVGARYFYALQAVYMKQQEREGAE
jgi:hypothetical protein